MSEPERKHLSIPGWFTIFTAVFAAGIWTDNCTSPKNMTFGNFSGHRIYRVVQQPTLRDPASYANMIFVTAADGETNEQIVGNLFMCKVSDRGYEWAEYLDTIWLRDSDCTRIAP